MIIGAGRLDKQIKLYEPTTEVTGGVHTTEYKLKYTVWANLKQVTLREIINIKQELQIVGV